VTALRCNPGRGGRPQLVDHVQSLHELDGQFAAAEQGAKSLNLQVQAFKVDPAYDFAGVFEAAAKGGAQLMMAQSGPAFTKYRTELAELAIKHRLPTMFTFRHYVVVGGLMSYGIEFPSMWRRTADYVARVLKGAKPAELPIELPTKFELVVNLKTAKALGVTIPNGILLAADEVIELDGARSSRYSAARRRLGRFQCAHSKQRGR